MFVKNRILHTFSNDGEREHYFLVDVWKSPIFTIMMYLDRERKREREGDRGRK
jgi:hypothetical protein